MGGQLLVYRDLLEVESALPVCKSILPQNILRRETHWVG